MKTSFFRAFHLAVCGALREVIPQSITPAAGPSREDDGRGDNIFTVMMKWLGCRLLL
jgi:hypothetical protein